MGIMDAVPPLLPVGPLSASGVQIHRSPGLVSYPEAMAAMEARVAAIKAGTAPECLWFLEHPPLYTAGTSAQAGDLLQPDRFPVFRTGRGGQYTYHGPGQRVVYAMLDLQRPRTCKADVRCYVHALEEWMIRSLARFGVTGERREDRIGIWVRRKPPVGPRVVPEAREQEDKIGAIGVRVRHWIAFHGIALNVAPDLGHFTGIVPCGIAAHGVTSLEDQGVAASMADVDAALQDEFPKVFALKA